MKMKMKGRVFALLVLSLLILSPCLSIGTMETETVGETSLQIYLEPSEYCDCDNPLIMHKADEIREEVIARSRSIDENVTEEELNREIAVKCFYWVRDNIPYALSFEFEPASETLNTGYGNCFPKSNLLVALCRANGIPARFHLIEISGKSIEDVLPEIGGLYQTKKAKFRHSTAEIYLNGRWIRAGCTRDKYLSPEKSHEWDGTHDTPAHPFKIKDLGTFANIDPEKIKAIKSENDEIWKICGDIALVYTDDLRYEKSGRRTVTPEKFEEIMNEVYENGKMNIKHKGSLKSILFYFKIINRLGNINMEILEKTPNKIRFTTSNPFTSNSYLVYAKSMEGGAKSIKPDINYNVIQNGEFEIEITTENSKGSILAYFNIISNLLGFVKNMIYTLWTR